MGTLLARKPISTAMVQLVQAAAACTVNCDTGVLKQSDAQTRLSSAHGQGRKMADHEYLKQKTEITARFTNRHSL